jgi:4-amino-4-deoxy-L-arabinose transferase-like glycosyltransferase
MLAGLALGLSGLTRASAALYLLLVPLWVFLAAQNTRQKIALPVVILLVSLITVLPWLLVLGDEEGHFMPLAATGSYNLYLGNNPWDADPRPTPLGYEGDTNQARRAINDYVDQHEIHPETAARRLALEEIRANPSGFVERSLARLRGFLGSDFFEIRHFAYAAYPPVPPAFILAMWALFILAFVLFLTFAITGLFGGAGLRHRNFILILALAGLVLPALTIANSRLYLPVLAILTPTAGAGIAAFRTLNRRRIFLTLMVALTIAAAVVASIPQTITRDLRPSLYYFDLIQGLKRFVPAEPFFSDGFLLHIDSPADDTLTVTILSEGLLFGENNARTLEWAVTKGPNEFSMTVYSDRPSPPLQIEIKSERLAQTITIEPIQRSTWWQWQPTELHGLEFMWAGGF